MKTSHFLLIAWLALVGILAFVLVKSLGGDAIAPLPGGTNTNGNTAKVGEIPTEGDEVEPGGGRVKPPPRWQAQFVKGTVLGPDDAPVGGATVRITLPVETIAPPETRNDAEIAKINDVIYIDPTEWDQPRPMSDWVANQQKRTATSSEPQEIASTVTDSDGRFSLEIPRYVGIGPFRVAAQASIGRAAAPGVRPGQDVELQIGPVQTAKGFVFSGGANNALPGAFVVLDDGEERFTGVTNDEGAFKIEGVAPGRYTVSAGAQGHAPLLGMSQVVKADEPIDIRLPRGTKLEVLATYEPEEGPDRPLPGAWVVVLEQDTFMYVMGTTGPDGIAVFENLPPGSYLVNGRGDRAVSFGEELVEVDGNQLVQEAELLFEPAIETQVTVVDAAGKPVSGMVFYTANADEVYDALRSQRVPGETDAQGRITFAFEFEGPRALIYGFKQGYSMVRAYPDAHDDAEPMTLVARPAIRVHGVVQTPEGAPVPDAVVILEVESDDPEDIDDYEIYIRSGPDGRYDFPYVPHGEIWLSAELGDDAWSDDYDVELEEGKTEYRVDIEMDLE